MRGTKFPVINKQNWECFLPRRCFWHDLICSTSLHRKGAVIIKTRRLKVALPTVHIIANEPGERRRETGEAAAS